MKTKLILLGTAIALCGMTGVSKASDQRPIYNSKGQIIAVASDASSARGSADTGPVKFVPGFSNKGGMVLVPSREPTTTIALFKSKKATCDAACCAKR